MIVTGIRWACGWADLEVKSCKAKAYKSPELRQESAWSQILYSLLSSYKKAYGLWFCFAGEEMCKNSVSFLETLWP